MYMKSMKFAHVVGTIMYIGCILSHIITGNIVDQTDLHAVYNAAVYKEISAYVLILPGIALKTVSGFAMFARYKVKPLWLKIKIGLAVFLFLNAALILAPMMPELRALAAESLAQGVLLPAFTELEHWELIAGVSNIVPLLLAVILGVYKPGFKRRKKAMA